MVVRALVQRAACLGIVGGMGKGAASSPLKVAEEAVEAQAAAHRSTPAKKQARIAELEGRARLFGDSVKQSAQAKVLERKCLRFLLVHGEEYMASMRRSGQKSSW